MTISTKSELKTALADELHRDDLTSKLDDFILMGESRLNRSLRMLDMVTTQTGTLSTASRTLALPERFAERVQFRINDPLRELIWVPPSRLLDYVDEENASGEPRFYTVTSTLEFDRVPDAEYSYTLKFFKGYRLTEDGDTNYVLQNYPQAYLYCSLMYGLNYIRDFDTAAAINGQLISEINSIKRAEARRNGASDALLVTELNTRATYSIDRD